MNIPKYMKMKLITVFTYFASSLFLNLVENKNIDDPKTEIATIIRNPNTDVSSQITTTPDSVADIHALVDSLKPKHPEENNFFVGVAKAGQYLIPEIKALRQKLESRIEQHEKKLKEWRTIIVNYCCAFKIRNVIELYPTRFHLSRDGARRRQNEVHEKIRMLLNRRKTITKDRIKELKNIINILTPKEGNADVEKGWALLKKIKYGLPKVISNPPTVSSYSSWTITVYNSNTSTLGINLVKLYEASDVETAKNIYNEQKNFWCSEKIRNIDDKELDTFLCSIPFENMFKSQCNDNQFLINEDEINYAVGIVKSGHFSNPDRSKYYDACLWIIYTVKHPYITKLQEMTNQRWPSMDRPSQYNLYCEEYAKIYNLISEKTMHGSGIMPPPECKPTDEECKSFIYDQFTRDGNAWFVAKTLYTLPQESETN